MIIDAHAELLDRIAESIDSNISLDSGEFPLAEAFHLAEQIVSTLQDFGRNMDRKELDNLLSALHWKGN